MKKPQRWSERGVAIPLPAGIVRDRDLVLVRLLGEGMDGGAQPLREGDYTFVDRSQQGQAGDAVVLELKETGYAVVREIVDTSTGRYYVARNLQGDSAHDAVILPEQVARVIGKVVGVWRDFEDCTRLDELFPKQ
jgi:SOS-response transcriptional repressor LexA